MKNLIKLIDVIILSVVMAGCDYKYNMPDLYVEYQFKVTVNNPAVISYVNDYGYEFLGQDVSCFFIDNNGDSREYKSNLLPDDIFSVKKDYDFFQIKQVCYGKPKIPGSYNTEVCTIIYEPLTLEKLKLYGEEQQPCPGLVTFGVNNVKEIVYNPDAERVFTINASMDVDPKYVTDYGYRFAGESSFYEFFDSEGNLKETKQSSPEGSINTIYPYTGGYIVYYGFSGSHKIEICKVYLKKELSKSLESAISKFEIDHIEYFVDQLFEFYISMPTDTKYVTDYGYRLADAVRYYQFYDQSGKLKETKKRPDGDNAVSTTYPYTGGYIEYYGIDDSHNIVKICTVYFKREKSEFLKNNSSKTTPYVLELENVEYYL